MQDFSISSVTETEVNFLLFMILAGWKRRESLSMPNSLSIGCMLCKLILETAEQEVGLYN